MAFAYGAAVFINNIAIDYITVSFSKINKGNSTK